jgi:hypothetical protein
MRIANERLHNTWSMQLSLHNSVSSGLDAVKNRAIFNKKNADRRQTLRVQVMFRVAWDLAMTSTGHGNVVAMLLIYIGKVVSVIN